MLVKRRQVFHIFILWTKEFHLRQPFSKNTLNDSPFPSCCTVWNTINQMPEVHVELNEPGDVTISYDKIYTPRKLGIKITVAPEFLIPLEDVTLHAKDGFFQFKDDKKLEQSPVFIE